MAKQVDGVNATLVRSGRPTENEGVTCHIEFRERSRWACQRKRAPINRAGQPCMDIAGAAMAEALREHHRHAGLRDGFRHAYRDIADTHQHTWRAGVAIVLSAFIATFLTISVGFATFAVVTVAAAVLGGALNSPMVVVALSGMGVFVAITVAAGVAAMVLAPAWLALLQARWRYHNTLDPLTMADGFREPENQGLMLFLMAFFAVRVGGYCLLIVPGVLVDALFHFVAPAVIVHGLSVRSAMTYSVRAFLRDPMWHLSLAVAELAIVAAGATIPFGLGALVVAPMLAQVHFQTYAFPGRRYL